MPEIAEDENTLLKELQAFREQFQTKYRRDMTDEEKRILDYAENLLKARTAEKQVIGA